MSTQEFLTRSQLASLFGVSPPTISRWAREGRLPSLLTLGGRRRYSRPVVEKLLEHLRQEPTVALRNT